MRNDILFINRTDRLTLIEHFVDWWRLRFPTSVVHVTHESASSPMKLIEKKEGAKFHVIPKLDAHHISTWLQDTILQYPIGCIVPLTDRDLMVLNAQRNFFEAHGATLAAPRFSDLASCLDKACYDRFVGEAWEVPAYSILNGPDIDQYSAKLGNFPWIVKPRNGSSSKDITIVKSSSEFQNLKEFSANFLVQKFVDGDHYTCDVLRTEAYKKIAVRHRDLVAGSQTVVMSSCKNVAINNIASEIADTINLPGIWNFQFIVGTEACYLHDINPRASSGIYHSVARGLKIFDYIESVILGTDIKGSEEISDNIRMYIYHTYEIYHGS